MIRPLPLVLTGKCKHTIKCKKNKIPLLEQFQKSNRLIVNQRQNRYLKHIYTSLSWLGTGTSIKGIVCVMGGVNFSLLAKNQVNSRNVSV